jgi:hypothetical protein
MIPGKIVRFLEERGNAAFAGARDRNMVPGGYRVSAWRVAADGRTITALVPDPFTDRLIESLQENGQFAMTVEEHPTHETYQFKGQYVRHRRAGLEDVALVARFRERFGRRFQGEIPPEVNLDVMLKAAVPDPTIAVDIDVREVYLQTPGPAAGSRIYPPPDA